MDQPTGPRPVWAHWPDSVHHVVPQRVDGLRLVDDHVVERLGASFGQVEIGHVRAAVQSCRNAKRSHLTTLNRCVGLYGSPEPRRLVEQEKTDVDDQLIMSWITHSSLKASYMCRFNAFLCHLWCFWLFPTLNKHFYDVILVMWWCFFHHFLLSLCSRLMICSTVMQEVTSWPVVSVVRHK